MALFVAAGVVTLLWSIFMLLEMPDVPRVRGVGGLVLRGAIYLAPGIAIGGIASARPRLRTFRCKSCKWTETVQKA